MGGEANSHLPSMAPLLPIEGELTGAEKTEFGVRAVLEAIKSDGQWDPDLVGILIAWGHLYQDMQGMDEADEHVLNSLMALHEGLE